MLKMSKSCKRGFTLLELLVVVLIIGILAAIALPQYKKAVLKSKFATMKDIVRTVTEAEQRYFLTNGEYTLNANELDIEYNLDKNNYIIFHGGYCALNWSSKPNERIICILSTTPQIALVSVYGSLEKYCRVMEVPDHKTDTLQDEICKQETGKVTPTISGSNNFYYY